LRNTSNGIRASSGCAGSWNRSSRVRRLPERDDLDPIYLRPAAELAERVLLPDDPHRALAVAQDLLDGPRMFNHARGLWGYTGAAADGEPLTIQSTGMGGPSAAIVVGELIALGARRLVRIGTCRALADDLPLGTLLAAEAVVPADGASAALGADGTLSPEPGMLEALVAGGARPATLMSSDLPAADADGTGALAVEMEAAAILRLAERHGAEAACVVGVVAAGGRRATPEKVEAIALRAGAVGYGALRARSR
jgi:uridine phosphorylase